MAAGRRGPRKAFRGLCCAWLQNNREFADFLWRIGEPEYALSVEFANPSFLWLLVIGTLTPEFGVWTEFFITGNGSAFAGAGAGTLDPRGGGGALSSFVTFKIIDLTTQADVNDFALDDIALNANLSNAVPEPTSITLFGLTAIGGAFYGWRRRERRKQVAK